MRKTVTAPTFYEITNYTLAPILLNLSTTTFSSPISTSLKYSPSLFSASTFACNRTLINLHPPNPAPVPSTLGGNSDAKERAMYGFTGG